MVFLSLVRFLLVRIYYIRYSNWYIQQKMDGVASAAKDHRARIKSILRDYCMLTRKHLIVLLLTGDVTCTMLAGK